jgi:hypothetical protein
LIKKIFIIAAVLVSFFQISNQGADVESKSFASKHWMSVQGTDSVEDSMMISS